MTDDVMRLRTLEEINAEYARRRKLAYGIPGAVARINREEQMAVARLLDNEYGAQRIREIRAGLRGAGR